MLPSSLINIAITPISRSDQASLHAALSEMVLADASLTLRVDEEAGHLVLGAISEQHLDMAVDRLRGHYKIDIAVGAPQVAYRETLLEPMTIDYTHKRLVRGKGEFARVKLLLAPIGLNDPCRFAATGTDTGFKAEFVCGVQAGFESVFQAGPFAGFPMLGIETTLVDAAWHEEDSSVKTFEIAARAAAREAMSKGALALLEPIMRVRVTAPNAQAPEIERDIRIRRGSVKARRLHGANAVLEAEAPLANMFKYEDGLRTLTLGQCSLEMQFSHYAIVPFPDDPPFGPAAAMRPG
jgi:elongation factor G